MADKDEFEREPEQADAFQPPPGELLTGARRNRGWSRERVAQELNLDLATIAALEEDRFEALGAPVFARGHLRKYALIMGLDEASVLSAYDAIAAEQPVPAESPAPRIADVSPKSSGGLWRFLIGLLVVAAVGVLVWRLTSNGERVPAPDEPSVSTGIRDDLQQEEAGPAAIPLPPRAAAPDEDLPSADRRAAEPDTAVAQPVGEPAAEPIVEQGAEPGTGVPPPTDDSAGAEADVTPAGATDPEPTPPPLDQVRVEMVFSADSWVEVRDPRGQRLIYQLGRQGDRRRIAGEPPLRVFLGFVDGVTIVVDGEPFQVPADRRLGNTARFTIPLDAGVASGR